MISQNSDSPRSTRTTAPLELDQPRAFPQIPELPTALPPPELTGSALAPVQHPAPDDPSTQKEILVSAVASDGAPALGTSSTPGPARQTTDAPTLDEIVEQPRAQQPPQANPNRTAVNLEATRASTSADAPAQSADSHTLAHAETEDSGPAVIPDPAPEVSAASTATLTHQAAPPTRDEELPPLPSDIAHSALPKPPVDVTPTSTAPLNSPITSSMPADELPPLPADIARPSSLEPKADSVSPPTALTSQAPMVATTPPVTSPEGVNNPAPSHTEDDGPKPVPGGSESVSLPNSASGLSQNAAATSSAAPPETVTADKTDSGHDSTNVSDANPTQTDVKAADSAALVGRAPAAALASEPDPTTSPGSAEAPTATASSGNDTATRSDAASIPSAIEDQGPIGSKTDATMPDRSDSTSILGPDLRREVERIARSQEAESRSPRTNERQPSGIPIDTSASDPRTQFQLDTSRRRARPRHGLYEPFRFQRIGSPWRHATGLPNASIGLLPPLATCRSTSKTQFLSATAIVSSNLSGRWEST